MKMTYKRSAGLTLMELLIVLAIIIALLAILLPVVNTQWKQWQIRRAGIQMTTIAGQIQQYNADHQGYPTTEQGLYALVYIPDGTGMPIPLPSPGGIPGQNFDPMMGGSQSVGPDMLMNQPNLMNPAMGIQGIMPGAIDPLTSQPIVDPMAGGSQVIGGSNIGLQQQTYMYNPQLYTQKQRRPTPYVQEKDLLDPWGHPYRYDNTRAHYGLNRTGSDMPAIWSVGPDGIDGTTDDIFAWDVENANDSLARHQLQMQQQQSGIAMPGQNPMMMDPNTMNNPMPFEPSNPMGGQQPFGPGQPGQTVPPIQQGFMPPMPQGPGTVPPPPGM